MTTMPEPSQFPDEPPGEDVPELPHPDPETEPGAEPPSEPDLGPLGPQTTSISTPDDER